MSKQIKINRKIYTGRSRILIKSLLTKKRGAVYWKEEKVNGYVQYMWLGKEFQAKDWFDAMKYIRKNEEEFVS